MRKPARPVSLAMRLHRLVDKWEAAVDAFAISAWSSVALWAYGAAWLAFERGVIGWDGWLTLFAAELALSIRRWQERRS
jgi:hypothetical protein